MNVTQRVKEYSYSLELSEREAKVLAVVLSRIAGDREAIEGFPSSRPLVKELWPVFGYHDPEYENLHYEMSGHDIRLSFDF